MKSISIVLDNKSSDFKSEVLRQVAIILDNETCAKGLKCSFTGDFIDGSLRISLSLISGEEFTYKFFIEVFSFVIDIFEQRNYYLKVKSVSSF